MSFPEYEGDFLGGAPDGKGVWHGRTGESLEGTFARGKPNGYGVLRLKNGDMVRWHNSKMNLTLFFVTVRESSG